MPSRLTPGATKAQALARTTIEGGPHQLPSDAALTDARTRAGQLKALLRFTPLTMLVNLANAALVAHSLRGTADPIGLAAWCATLGVMVLMGVRAWARTRRGPARATASKRAIRRAALHAGLLSAVWAIVPAVWFPGAGAQEQLVLGTVITGMICAGGFAMATVPEAATAYVTVLVAGTLAGVLQSDVSYRIILSLLLAAYTAVVWKSAISTANLFVERFRAEADLEVRGQVIAMLLAEFEENGSDWLFELDGELCIVGHSARFAQVSERPDSELTGRCFLDLLDVPSRTAVQARVDARRPFRDLQVAAVTSSGVRWWSISATPIHRDGEQLTGWRGVGSDTTDVKLAQDEIAWMARTDILTGLPNRAAFRDRASEALLVARAGGPPLSIGCLDLDHFKAVNDGLGHAAGDLVLREVAATLTGFAERGLLAGRLGGDEFGLLFRGNDDVSDVQALAEEVIAAISREYDVRGTRVRIGASVGLAVGLDDGEYVDEIMGNADLALYRSKDTARGSVTRYSRAMRRESEEQHSLKEDLRSAVELEQFVLHYQPIIDSRSGRTVAFEALVRWRHPERGLVPPDRFIGLAESSGMIGPLGDWVLRNACKDAAQWPEHIRIAVNLSPAQLGRATLKHTVVEAFEAAGLPARRLELEITEALLLSHEESTVRFLADMRALGVGVALDDFGIGFSSLNYLTRYPVSKIKIDRSFVSGGASIAHRGAIIEAVASLATKLGLETTAEGVETEEALAWVTTLGCSQAQGFYISRPMAADLVMEYLRSERNVMAPELRLVG